MKTFEDMKHKIPEGATHYSDESDDGCFAWYKKIHNTPFLWCVGYEEEWISMIKPDEFNDESVKPIPQTNIETPEEKEALDSIDVKLIKPREPSKPVITKIEWGGAGLPPVGSLCKVNRDPFVYRVMYSSEYVVIVQNLDNDNTTAHGMDIILDLRKGDYTFSKPETPQQREEREREEFKVEMCKGLGIDAVGCNTACIINKLYELGYRKEG